MGILVASQPKGALRSSFHIRRPTVDDAGKDGPVKGLHPRLIGVAIKDWSNDTDLLLVRFKDSDGNILLGYVKHVEDHLIGGKEIILEVESHE